MDVVPCGLFHCFGRFAEGIEGRYEEKEEEKDDDDDDGGGDNDNSWVVRADEEKRSGRVLVRLGLTLNTNESESSISVACVLD